MNGVPCAPPRATVVPPQSAQIVQQGIVQRINSDTGHIDSKAILVKRSPRRCRRYFALARSPRGVKTRLFRKRTASRSNDKTRIIVTPHISQPISVRAKAVVESTGGRHQMLASAGSMARSRQKKLTDNCVAALTLLKASPVPAMRTITPLGGNHWTL